MHRGISGQVRGRGGLRSSRGRRRRGLARDTGPEIPGITGREREVLWLVGLGMSNAETATTLYITTGTAKTHVARLLAKLGARDRVQLVITAYEAGLVSAPQ